MHRSILCLAAAMAFFSGNSWAQQLRAAYVEGSVKELPEKTAGTLKLGAASDIVFNHKSGNWHLPFSRIKTIYVSLSRRSALGELFGLSGIAIGAAKQRKLLVSLAMVDERGRNARSVFYLPDGGEIEFFQSLEKESGRTVIYESEEARLAAAGNK